MKKTIQRAIVKAVKPFGEQGVDYNMLCKIVSQAVVSTDTNFDVAISRIDGLFVKVVDDTVFFIKNMPKKF